ncbi:MAG: hypothetical protein ACPGVV_08885, partial [Croceimicrobium sp.]
IHVGSGQEKHLPHEAWHVVQQMQGRVKPTMKVNGQQINDSATLEKEADVMGSKAMKMNNSDLNAQLGNKSGMVQKKSVNIAQLAGTYAYGSANTTPHIHVYSGGDCHLKIANNKGKVKREDLGLGGLFYRELGYAHLMQFIKNESESN